MTNEIKIISRKLRKSQTSAEGILWKEVRGKKFFGLKFLRQYPIKYIINNKKKYFIVDFYCSIYRLAIEVDGRIHLNSLEQDRIRDEILRNMGYNIVRFKNEEIDRDVEKV